MQMGLGARLRRAWQKNADELRAFAAGRMPDFVTGGAAPPGAEPPVFCFHDVGPERFEAQLRYLRDNGYRTLGTAELEARLRTPAGAAQRAAGGPAVALSFDDATCSFWSYAFPLLERFGARAILFAIAGLVPDDPTPYPHLGDVRAGRAGAAELARRAERQPLCTWRELGILQRSGLVDIQSHSMTHSRVPISARVVDYFHPGYPLERYGNVNLPVPARDDPREPLRALALGAPIFESASRMAGVPRFKESPAGVAALAALVRAGGNERFFRRPGWRRELARIARRIGAGWGAAYESAGELETSLLWELSRSKSLLEERLAPQRVSHFCYPWFQGSALSDALAARAGYTALHYGLALPREGPQGEAAPLRIRRLPEDYLERLAGAGRVPLAAIARRRLRASLGRRRDLP